MNEGIGLLVDRHPELLRAEYALSEFGGATTFINGRSFYPVQTAEKGTAWMRIVAHGRPGHASVPHDENPLLYLAQAIDKNFASAVSLREVKTMGALAPSTRPAVRPPARCE